jgi:MFS family permease
VSRPSENVDCPASMRAVRLDRFGMRAWLQILLCAIGGGVSVAPVAVIPMSVILKPLSVALGWGRGDVSLMLTFLTLSLAISMPAAGFLIDRFGVWKVAAPSMVCFGMSMLLMPFVIAHFGLFGLYFLSCFIGAVGSASSTVLYSKLISGWFDKGRGLALGCATCGVAIGGAMNSLVVAHVVEAYGWKAGFRVLAIFPLLIGLPTLFALRSAALGTTEPTRETIKDDRPNHGKTFSEAIRTSTFLILLLVSVASALTLTSVPIHLAGLMSDRGFSPSAGAAAVGGMFLLSVPARVVVGLLFDRIFAPRVNGWCFAGAAIGIALLTIPNTSIAMVWVSVALLSIGIGAETDFLAYVVGRYFGIKAFARIYGALFAGFLIGNSVGPYLLGASYDAYHSYVVALILCAIGLAASAAAVFLLPQYPKLSLGTQ